MTGPEESARSLLVAYSTLPGGLRIATASACRQWMDDTRFGFANRCLPLRIANQSGWYLLNNKKTEVVWNGGSETEDLVVKYPDLATSETGKEVPLFCCSHFGFGIVTWRIPYLFRTPPGYNLYVRGPTNWCKDGATPLDAIVEADWSTATFTMNWKITRAGQPIVFDEDEPICMIFPEARGSVEAFSPEIRNIAEDPALEAELHQWAIRRYEFNQTLEDPLSKPLWQKHYYAGRSVGGQVFHDHQVELRVSTFLDRRNGS
jgi:hypothetical protein